MNVHKKNHPIRSSRLTCFSEFGIWNLIISFNWSIKLKELYASFQLTLHKGEKADLQW